MTAALVVAAFVAWWVVGVVVAHWAWAKLGIGPTSHAGRFALGAAAWVWPILAAAALLGSARPRYARENDR